MRSFLEWFRSLATNWGRSPLALAAVVFGLVLLVASFGFYWIELRPAGKGGFFSALYWAVVTLTTVGYGDLTPSTFTGRILSMIVMGSGVVLLSALSANLASLLVERQAQKRMGLLSVKLINHVVILGWNQLGTQLVRTLVEAPGLESAHIVIVSELPQEERDELSYQLAIGHRLHFVHGNPAQKNVLAKAGVDQAKVVYIVAQENLPPDEADQQSICAALTLRSLAPKVSCYGEAMLASNREHLMRAGINEILARGETGHHILGLMVATPSILPFFQNLIGLGSKGMLRYKRLTPDEKQQKWGALSQTERTRNGTLPMALCKESKSFNLQDMLDASSALDQFVLELFQASGRSTQLGHTLPEVMVNPDDSQALAGFDGVLLLAPGAQGGGK